MKAAFGGGAQDFTDAALDRLQNNYKMSEGQLVEQDLAPHKEIVDRLHARGMKAIYNVEAIWINSGFNVNSDISGYIPQLQAIKNAGWDAAISEGLSEKQVSVIRSIIPYINEGGEMGEDVYSGGMYHRPFSMADGNYLECYHFGVNYDAAFTSANQSTPDNMGMTFMLYTTATLEMAPASLINYIDSLINRGIKIKKMTFWVGFGQSALNKLDNDFNFLWTALNNKYGFTRDDPAPTPPEPSKPVDSFNMYIQKAEPGHVRILFFSVAADGTPANGNPVILNDLWPDRKPKRLAAGKTGADGKGWANFDLTLPKKKYLFQIVSGDVKVETSWVDLS